MRVEMHCKFAVRTCGARSPCPSPSSSIGEEHAGHINTDSDKGPAEVDTNMDEGPADDAASDVTVILESGSDVTFHSEYSY